MTVRVEKNGAVTTVIHSRADRRSVYLQHGLPVDEALRVEWENSSPMLSAEGVEGASRFKDGKGRHGDFGNI